MKLLINASNLVKGGAIQVGISFLEELKLLSKDNKYFVFLSSQISKQIDESHFPNNFTFYKVNNPKPFFISLRTKKIMRNHENRIKPDCVFSIFAPTYWRPKSLHVMGFALGWTINPDTVAYRTLSFKDKLKKRIQNNIKLKISISNADYFIGETEIVQERLAKYGNISKERIFVVGNTYASHFNEKINTKEIFSYKAKNEFTLITISANYPHKNLNIIKSIIPLLKNQSIIFKFILTIPSEDFNREFSKYSDSIINLGEVNVNECPKLYKESDALFLPTLLESFSASYPEAMISGIPIITSDLDFARAICEDAAVYFDPFNARDIANKIIKVATDQKIYNDLVSNGYKRVANFPSANERAMRYLGICKSLINKNSTSKNETNHTIL